MVGFDLGVNYTFEKDDDKTALDLFSGMYKSIGPSFLIFLDYSLGLNDDCRNNEITGRGRGYLSAGVQFRISDNLTLKLLMHDLFENRRSTELFDRSIQIDYRWFF